MKSPASFSSEPPTALITYLEKVGVTPKAPKKAAKDGKTTAQKLSATGFPGLYRHDSGQYYGKKKVKGIVKVSALRTENNDAITDRKLAEKAFLSWVDSLEQQAAAGGKRMTLDALIDTYNALQVGKEDKTIAVYEWAAKNVRKAAPELLGNTVDKITPLHVSQILAKWSDFKPRSYNRLSEYLHRLFALAVNNGNMVHSPYQRAENKRKRVTRHKPNIPTLEQFNALVDHVRNVAFADTRQATSDLIEFLGLAALGEAEADSLKWGAVNFGAGEIRVTRKKTGAHFTVLFTPWLKSFLERYYEEQEKPGPDVKMFKVKGCKAALQNACKRLKFPHFSPRNLRQFGIVRQLRKGVPVKLVAEMNGHRDGGKLMMDTYSEVISADDLEYKKKLLASL